MCLQGVLFLSLFVSHLNEVLAFPNGSPPSACPTMIPGHPGTLPQPTRSPYIIKISSKSFINGKPIQVQILGPGYRGILIECRTFRNTGLLGTWIQPPNNTKLLNCLENPSGAVTHSNTNLKTEATTFTWIPPVKDIPHILYFVATVAESFDVYWLDVRSALLWIDPAARSSGNKVAWITVVSITIGLQFTLLITF